MKMVLTVLPHRVHTKRIKRYNADFAMHDNNNHITLNITEIYKNVNIEGIKRMQF